MITLVNTFEVHDEDTSNFERVFRQSSEFMSSQPGFLGYHLVRSSLESNKYFNVASWASQADLRSALATPQMREHQEHVCAIATTDPHPCITVLEVLSEGERRAH